MLMRKKSVAIGFALVTLVGLTSACSSSSTSPEAAPAAIMSQAPSTDTGASSTTLNYQVPDAVMTDYFQAICEGSTAKLGMGGTYDSAASTCTDAMGTVTTKASVVETLLGSTPDQMLSSIQMMVVQVGSPVTDCPTALDFNTKTDLTVTDSCVENALTAMTKYMNS